MAVTGGAGPICAEVGIRWDKSRGLIERMPNIRCMPLFGALCLSFTAAAQAAVVQGTITDAQRHPLNGAMISVRDDAKGFYETVYTDAAGHYHLSTAQQGDLVLRARKLSFADASKAIYLDLTSAMTVDISLDPLTDPHDIYDNLSAAAHFSKIPFDATGPSSREAIQMPCANCHALGTAFNRVPRLPEDWATVVSRMLIDNVAVPYTAELNELTEARSNMLAQGFDDSLPKHPEIENVSPELSKAKVTEWAVRGDTPFPFGIAASSVDGKMYVTDNGLGRMVIIDPKSEEVKPFPLSTQPNEDGVVFGPQAEGFSPRGIADGGGGKMYFTIPRLGLIGVLDTVPELSLEGFRIAGASDPGAIRVGRDGVVWWTHFLDLRSDQQVAPAAEPTQRDADDPAPGIVGRFDPTTGEVTLIDLPQNTAKDYEIG